MFSLWFNIAVRRNFAFDRSMYFFIRLDAVTYQNKDMAVEGAPFIFGDIVQLVQHFFLYAN